jgi:predicted dehydrogenase/nucleoside-diphosphate-sugar epimerase
VNGVTEKLRVGIIGCGKMGIQHIRAVKQMRRAELVGVSDPGIDPETMKGVLPVGVPFFKNVPDLFRSANPNVVHVVTPPASHFELAMMALNHGAHVLVEKPFTLERTHAEEIAALAEARNLHLCAGHQLLFEYPSRVAESLLSMIGSVVHMESYFSFRPVRRSPGGGGAIGPLDQLMDILPHPVYVLLKFLRTGCTTQGSPAVDIRFLEADPSGEVIAILRLGSVTGRLVVTLNGRPVESYLRIIGTNGSMVLDFVRGSIVQLPGPGTSAIPILLNPYSEARQIAAGAVKGFFHLVAAKKKGIYPGVQELIEAFYAAVLDGNTVPIPASNIVETVGVCETIGNELRRNCNQAEAISEATYRIRESELGTPDATRGRVLVTGGTGFLGRKVAAGLRMLAYPVRVPARTIPAFSKRVPGVEYVKADLADPLPSYVMDGIRVIVHCAAETAGNKEAHERNSVLATRNILEAASAANVGRFIHISSIAVLKSSREMRGPVDESTPLDLDNEGRGPYVWGKAESERLLGKFAKGLGVDVRIIRLGPLVDFNDYAPPGRLGREVGRLFVCMGNRREKLSVCDIETAANVIRYYVERFEESPPILNLVEPDAPSRKELFEKMKKIRPDLRPIFVPGFLVKSISPPMKLLQNILMPGRKPIDIYSAFSPENYRTDLANKVISLADPRSTRKDPTNV